MIIYYLNNGPRKNKIVISFPETYDIKEPLGYEVSHNGIVIQSDKDLNCLVLGPLESREFEDPLSGLNIHDFYADVTNKDGPLIFNGDIKFKAFNKKQAKEEISKEFDRLGNLRKMQPGTKIRLDKIDPI